MTDLYVVPAGGNSNVAATYSLTDGGVPGILTPASGDTIRCTALSGNLVWVGSQSFDNLICTGYTNTMSGSGTPTILGSTLLLVAGMTYTATGAITFTGANAVGDVTLTRAGKSTNQNYTFDGVGKIFKLADAHNVGASSFNLTNGTLNSQGFAIACGILDLNNTNIRTATLTGTILTAVTAVRVDPTNLTWAAPDEVILSPAGSPATTILLAGVAFEIVTVNLSAGAANRYGFAFAQQVSAFSIEELRFTGAPSATMMSLVMRLENNCAINKATFVEGVYLISGANGTQRTITTATNEISFDGCMIRDIAISGGPAIAQNSINLGNNSGITFQNFGPATHEIEGVTYDDAGDPLGSCLVYAFKDVAGELVQASSTTSDAVTGAYTLGTPDATASGYVIVATKTSGNRGDAMVGITPTVP